MEAKKLIKAFLKYITKQKLFRCMLLTLTRRNLLPRTLWVRLPIQGVFTVSPIEGNSFDYSFTPEDIVSNYLFWKGSYEFETMSVFSTLVKDSRVILDIGANTGIYTLQACSINPNVQVIAYEPVPQVYKILVENLKINNFQSRCQALEKAVSNYIGNAKFSVLEGNVPSSSSLNPKGYRDQTVSSIIDVTVTKLDRDCQGIKYIDLVKIDVEGFEDQVLEGMQIILADWHPIIIVECNYDGPYRKVESLLREHGYQFFYEISDKGLMLSSEINPSKRESASNYVCGCQEINFQF